MFHQVSFFLLSLCIVIACSFNENSERYKPLTEVEIEAAKSDSTFFQEGLASFYASRFHNQKTASGEPYDSLLYTAAHKTLPLHSIVTVVNVKNGKRVTVRINDRGPYAQRKIIDLSKAAANEIGLTRKKGVVRVLLFKESDKPQ